MSHPPWARSDVVPPAAARVAVPVGAPPRGQGQHLGRSAQKEEVQRAQGIRRDETQVSYGLLNCRWLILYNRLFHWESLH